MLPQTSSSHFPAAPDRVVRRRANVSGHRSMLDVPHIGRAESRADASPAIREPDRPWELEPASTEEAPSEWYYDVLVALPSPGEGGSGDRHHCADASHRPHADVR